MGGVCCKLGIDTWRIPKYSVLFSFFTMDVWINISFHYIYALTVKLLEKRRKYLVHILSCVGLLSIR